MSGKPKKWLVDGEWVTVREAAERMGYTAQQFYSQMRQKRCGLQAVVTMAQENLILNGGHSSQRHMVNGRWMTVGQAAEQLGVSRRALYEYIRNHRRPDGSQPTLSETIEAYRRGEVRHGGSEPAQHRVGRKTMTTFEAAEMLGIRVTALRLRMSRKKQTLAQCVQYYEKRKIDRAQKAIMDILRGK